jgi:hypothetical protein
LSQAQEKAKKEWGRPALHGLASIMAGIACVYGIVLILAYDGEQARLFRLTTSRMLEFPKDEQALNALSARLARESAALSGVEPAAGR